MSNKRSRGSRRVMSLSCHLLHQAQEDRQREAVHVVEALQVLHEEEQGRTPCCQRTVHLTLLIQSCLQAVADFHQAEDC